MSDHPSAERIIQGSTIVIGNRSGESGASPQGREFPDSMEKKVPSLGSLIFSILNILQQGMSMQAVFSEEVIVRFCDVQYHITQHRV